MITVLRLARYEPRQKLSRPTVAAALALGVLLNAFAVVEPSRPALRNFDVRQKEVVLRVPAERREAAAKLRERLPQAQIDFHEITGSPKRVAATDGFLTGLNGIGRTVSEESARGFPVDDPHRATKAFLKGHQPLFGHGPEALEKAHVKREYVTPHNGLRTVVWEQQLDGIPVFEAVLMSHTTKRGELVSISSQLVANVPSAADKGHRNKAHKRDEPRLSAAQAVIQAAENVGEHLQPAEIQPQGQAEGAVRKQQFRAKNLTGQPTAKLVWLPMSPTEMRLCWEVVLTSRMRGEMFRVLIDAESGEALVRHGLTDYASEATFRVHTSDSPSPFSPGHSVPSTLEPPLIARELVTLTALDTNASPLGWINEGDNETRGNNVDAHSDRDYDNEPDLPRPQGSPFRVFDFPLDLTQHPTNYTKAAIVQLFYWCNWMHDRLYEFGFTEAAGNFQLDNLGRGGEGNDPVNADAQDGGFFSNSNFSTPPDGEPGRMQMFIWTEPYPDRDGDLDAEVILHEYTHGMTRRRVGGGIGFSALQSQGMNEGWSDFFALSMLSQSADDVDGVYAMAGYSSYLLGNTQNYYFGIRRYPYCTDTNKNPLTLKDIDPGQISSHPEVPRHPAVPFSTNEAIRVHRQGELWCTSLWGVRANLIHKHGFEVGNRLTLQLVADGQSLCPPNPNFLQARDAMLQADFVNNDGANFREIWAGFAKRGMGFSATAPVSTTSRGVHEAFDVPDDLWRTPRTEWVAKGRAGGPFEPVAATFSLENLGVSPIHWSVRSTVAWLSVSNSSGMLETNSPAATVRIFINDTANFFPSGVYSGAVVFTNHSTGRAQSQSVTLQIGQLDFLTENFDLRDNDLDFQSLEFTPDGSPSFYSVCRSSALSFPVDPGGGTPFGTNWSDGTRQVTLSAGHSIALFGLRTNSFFVNRDGSISFLRGEYTAEWVLSEHFVVPRISALRLTYEFTQAGRSWKELEDRVVVTAENLSEPFATNRNSFQIEVFYDGRIRFTYLQLDARGGIVGLSRGLGIPPGFVESDFTAYPQCQPPLTLVAPTNLAEHSGSITGSVGRPFPDPTDLVVTLASSDSSEIMVPASVVISAGQTNATFAMTVLDDGKLDGTQALIVTASAAGYSSGYRTIFVSDNETTSITISVPAAATKGERVEAVVSLASPAEKNVVVTLIADKPLLLDVPPVVIIPAGESSAVFTVSLIDDSRVTAAQSATLTAQVPGWVAGSVTISIQDNHRLQFQVSLPQQISEAAGAISNRCAVQISGTLQSNLVVSLDTSDPLTLNAPPIVLIPAGQTSTAFNLVVTDDSEVNGQRSVVITAHAPGWTDGPATVTIVDDETPAEPFEPNPSNLASNQALSVLLSWKSGLGNLITNGDFESGNFTGWSKESFSDDPDGGGTYVRFVITDGTYVPDSDNHRPNGPVRPYAGDYSALAAVDGCNSGYGQISQDISLPSHASSATLSWVDRIMNDSAAYSPTQYFTVEVRGTNNVLWERLLFTAPGFPPINDWTTRSFSLSRYLGETIRLVWKQEYYCYKLNSYLDNVALQVTSTVPTVFDVYLGTNAIPGPAEFRATTSSPSWNAIDLQPGTAYFWKVSAKRGGAEISSPTWQFTTTASPGIDHFKWSAIATQQFVGEPFYVSLTAQGLTNNTISTFSEPTRITGSLMSGRRQLFYYDFEDGNFSGWTTGSSSYSQFVTTQTAASGRYSLSLVGGAQTHVDGLKYAFPRFSMRPDRVNFAVRASATDKAGGFLAIGNDGGSYGVGVMFYMGPSGRMGIYERGTGFHGTNYAAQQWYRVSLVFDWTRKRIGCLINGQTVATDVPFQNSFLDDVASLHLYNFDYTQVWYDDIEIIDGDRTLPLLVGPAEVSGFLNGIWTGQITPQEPATKMWLSATDTSGHRGFSGEFDVDSSADSDGDGLPDAWELRYFGSLNANPNEDPDRDGLTNLREFQAGTLPNAALSTLPITAVEVSGGLVRLGFNSVAGKMYQFERTGALDAGAWQLLGSAMLGDGTTLQFVDADGTNLPARFYRIRLVR